VSVDSPRFHPELVARAVSLRADVAAITTAYRVLDDAADGCPGVTVDRYADYAVVALYEDAAATWLLPLAEALVASFARGVYVKHHTRGDLRQKERRDVAPALPVTGEPAPDEVSIEEHGMRLGVALHDGLSTGLFTDQRDNRRLVKDLSKDARVLNLFSYTCSFSVAAALGGAAETISVDLSRRALERGRQNLARNALPLEGHKFFQEDAMAYVARAARRGERFDVVVLDPPSFGTRGKGTFSVERDYAPLAERVLTLVAPGGHLLAVTNHRKTSANDLRTLLDDAARRSGRIPLTLRELSPPADHRFRPGGEAVAKSILVSLKN
jgi:23S rRNA (cytosine1962-C5)-methyltransferase